MLVLLENGPCTGFAPLTPAGNRHYMDPFQTFNLKSQDGEARLGDVSMSIETITMSETDHVVCVIVVLMAHFTSG